MENNLSEMLMNGVEEMHKLLMSVDKKGFNIDKAKLKILANNSLNATAKTIIQNEILKETIKRSGDVSKLQNHLLLGGE